MTNPHPQRLALLEATLALVPFDGWNSRTLERAAHKISLDASQLQRHFPGGIEDMLHFYAQEMNRRMLAMLATQNLASMKIRQRIAVAVRARLEVMEPYREAERRAVAHYANPLNAATGLRHLFMTVSEMWYAAGDTATDFNYYTKRGLLAKVYSATLLFWLNDASEGYADSWSFLNRRIENVMQFQKVKSKVTQWVTAWSPVSKRR